MSCAVKWFLLTGLVDYEMTPDTVIQKCHDNDVDKIPQAKYDFISIEDFANVKISFKEECWKCWERWLLPSSGNFLLGQKILGIKFVQHQNVTNKILIWKMAFTAEKNLTENILTLNIKRILASLNVGHYSGNQWFSMFSSESGKVLGMTSEKVGHLHKIQRLRLKLLIRLIWDSLLWNVYPQC